MRVSEIFSFPLNLSLNVSLSLSIFENVILSVLICSHFSWLSHTHSSHSLTHTLSHIRTHSLSLKLTHTRTLSLSPSHTHAHTHSLSLSHTLTHTLFHPPCFLPLLLLSSSLSPSNSRHLSFITHPFFILFSPFDAKEIPARTKSFFFSNRRFHGRGRKVASIKADNLYNQRSIRFFPVWQVWQSGKKNPWWKIGWA